MTTFSYSKHIQGTEPTTEQTKCIQLLQPKNTVKQLHKGFLRLLRWTSRTCEFIIRTNSMEDNVKGGHFSVVALGNGKPVEFIIRLRYLTHPKFLELLDKAEQEFGS